MKNYILCYHGVASESDLSKSKALNVNGKHISENTFYNQMLFLSRYKNVISIDDLITGKNIKQENIVITFDDGFKNNIKAAEILNNLNLPATFYLCIGNILDNKMFWVDILEDFIYNHHFKKCNLDYINKTINISSPDDKINSLKELKFILKRISKFKRHMFFENLYSDFDFIPNIDNPLYKVLSISDVKLLVNDNLFTIGGHTYYHDPVTTFDSKEEIIDDTQKTISSLHLLTKKKIIHYSFPEGTKDFYNKNSIEVLKQKGIIFCPTADFGINKKLIFPNFTAQRILVGFENIEFPFQI